MLPALASTFDPERLARESTEIRGQIALLEWPRLVEASAGEGGPLSLDLEFRMSEDQIPLLEGTVTGPVKLECQRCLEPVEFELELGLALAFVAPGEEERVPPTLDAWAGDGEGRTVGQVLEDEVLLTLPVSPAHEDRQQCGKLADWLTEQASDEGPETQRPFAGLKDLM